MSASRRTRPGSKRKIRPRQKSTPLSLMRSAKREIRKALCAFESLTKAEQLTLAKEIAVTRRSEFEHAYGNLASLAWGNRRRRNKRSGRPRLTGETCVIFIVKRKWPRGQRAGSEKNRLPQHLLAYWTIDKRRRLCAVPTDVEEAKSFTKARAHLGAPGIVLPTRPGASQIGGAVACVIRRPESAGDLYGLSCRHVLSMSEYYYPREQFSLSVESSLSPGNEIGQTLPIAGELEPGPTPSFDAQLFKVANYASVRATMGQITFKGSALEHGLPESYYVIGKSGPVKVNHHLVSTDLGYTVTLGGTGYKCIVPSLVRSTFDDPSRKTKPGDSGSPVMSDIDGGFFLGMHVAGDDEGTFMIPAWNLLDPSNYGQGGMPWQLVMP